MAVVQNTQRYDMDRLSQEFEVRLARSLEVCDLLEALADELPRRSVAVWRVAKQQCQDVLQDHLTYGAERVLPRLMRRSAVSPDQLNLLLRFQSEYAAMADRVDDLDDLFFDAVATDRNRIGSEALGYALRSHFDALRKHIGWENDILLPMTARPVSPAE